jgi:hypothetical protein
MFRTKLAVVRKWPNYGEEAAGATPPKISINFYVIIMLQEAGSRIHSKRTHSKRTHAANAADCRDSA